MGSHCGIAMGAGSPHKLARAGPGGPQEVASASSSASPPPLQLEPLPAEPDAGLTAELSCDVLTTKTGLIKGSWADFKATTFYRKPPGEDPLKGVRHILIQLLDIVRYAEREGEMIEAEEIGEGSYSRVFASGPHLAAKVISDRERPWVHKAATEHAVMADRLGLGPRVFGYGRLAQKIGGHFDGTVLFMERLQPVSLESWSQQDTAILLEAVRQLSTTGLHNDLKLPNVLRRGGRPVLIDFDLFAPWSAKVAVTSSCIEHSFRELLEPLGETTASQFREYYDLFAFSLTLKDGELYRAVLGRLQELWPALEEPALKPLLATTDPEKLKEVPLEVMVRVPLEGVTVNLLDLRGNLYAHLDGDVSGRQARLQSCAHLSQLLISQGIYWPS